jgi:serine/threonine protein kinase
MMLLVERAYYRACLALGRLLRSGRYSKTRIVCEDGERQVQKRRVFHAPLLIWMGGGLMTVLDTGVRVLPQREWEQRERRVYRSLYGTSVDSSPSGGTLVLPWLPGKTLASLLEDPKIEQPVRNEIIERAVIALAAFHRLGLTHGDAMAENVMIDVEARVARWFDFETMHESSRRWPMPWQRADDVRALLVTCLVRTAPERRAETLQLVLDVYADEEVTRLLATRFGAVVQRPLMFHLAQAALSIQGYRGIVRCLTERLGD